MIAADMFGFFGTVGVSPNSINFLPKNAVLQLSFILKKNP